MRSNLRDGRACCARFWREGHRQALNDIRTRWRTGGLWLFVLVWSIGLSLSLATLARLSTSSRLMTNDNFVACQPDGTFGLYPERYQYWSRAGLFQITLGYGSLTFTQAKVIDIFWDVICGRGGQALIALVSWHVFVNYVTTSMEVTPITFNTYRTVFLQHESLTVAIPRLIRDFACRRGLHSKVAMVFMIATMIFISVFPSFASAMTGYSGKLKSYIPDAGNNYISFDGFRSVTYVIHDGWRVGLTGNYILTYNSIYGEPVLDDPYFEYYPCQGEKPCDIQQRTVTKYVSQYGFYGLENKNSNFSEILLGPPVLNISALYLSPEFIKAYSENSTTQFEPFKSKSRNVWTYGNNTYDMDYISSLGTCQAIKDYQWGFSFIQLNIMIILCILWTVGILIMWIQSHFTMKNRGRTDVAGDYKAVLELADALNTQLVQAGDIDTKDILNLPVSKLRRRITKDLHGGLMTYETPLLTSGDTGECNVRNGFRSLLKKEAWWIILILMSLGAGFGTFIVDPYMGSWGFFGFSATLVLTVCIGSSGKSRGVLFLWSFPLLCLIPLISLILLVLVSKAP